MEYEIKYSDRKTVSLKVKDGRLTVYAPKKITKTELDKIVESHTKWINSKIAIQNDKKEIFSGLTDKDIADIKKSARKYFEEKTKYYAQIMGAEYGKITITSAKTRFGSCTSSKNIAYTYRLMLYPEQAREYVVVHELAHTFEMNHSSRFYAIIERILPDYKARKKLLK